MTSPERLLLLLPLANRDALSPEQIKRCVFRFLRGFEARGLRLPSGQQELGDVLNASDAELKAVAEKVARVFFTGLSFEQQGTEVTGAEGITPDDIRLPLTFPSLRFGAFSPTRPRRREDERYMLMIEAGRLRDLVPFLVMWLLTTGGIVVSRCSAPGLRRWKERCDRVLIWKGHGRPPLVCEGGKCAARVKAQRKHEQERRERKVWQATQREKAKKKEKRS